VCVLSCVCGAMEEEDMSNQKREKRDEKEEQHEEQLEEVSLLQSSPCKPTMVAEVEVCCRCHELSIVIKVCCLHQNFLSFFNLIFLLFISLVSFLFSISFLSFLLVF
jgi:hypothetical protein